MRFETLTPFDAALTTFLAAVEPIEDTETAPIREARGRVLAQEIIAQRDEPNYRRAAMDGYAVIADDTRGASVHSPVVLRIGKTTRRGVASRVHTGSKMPKKADAVVMVEDTDRLGDVVEISAQVIPSENVGLKGEDVSQGEHIFAPGHHLRPADIGLLASLEVGDVIVYRRPEVAIIPTGEELVEKRPAEGEVVETNGLMNTLLVEEWGAHARYRDIVPDSRELIETALLRDIDADMILTSGGTSVGIRDLVPQAVRKLGKLLVHGIAISPAKPTALGLIEHTPIACLPGFPVASLVASHAFAKPAIYRLGHIKREFELRTSGMLRSKLLGKPGSRTYARVTIENRYVAPVNTAPGSGILSSMTKADGFVIIPENVEGYDEGQQVEVILFE
ncbi:MAG TPA: molybdopterin molybdotransferase MoeA [Candidatus Acidoferrales bacterium]|nr:molybdopterin molybdotransferase MoeA [Candidatus Acidoferrales bacterium]